MALLKFNKPELVNLSYSLRREIICANKTGAYCNTSIIGCNTRRYHGLLAVTLDRFGGDKYILLSSLDESLIVGGKQFNLGIHCYGDLYEPRGHKYIVDFKEDPAPEITFKIGDIVFRKTLLLVPDQDRVMVKFELVESPSDAVLQLRPFLPFRNQHALTVRNDQADTDFKTINNGASFCLYPNFPELNMQMNAAGSRFVYSPCWYDGITYSDEYRRGFDCREDLFVPGWFEIKLKAGSSAIFSASVNEEDPKKMTQKFKRAIEDMPEIASDRQQLVHAADLLICNHNSRKKINAGFSWMYTGLLRETLVALAGLTLHGKRNPEEFEEILDNLIADEQERLTLRTTQVEAPLYLARTLQEYLEYGADPARVWGKYGSTLRAVIESYRPGIRKEVSMQPDGLLWAEMPGVALSWMNAYINGNPVTPRAGYQVETNAMWYNALCFAIDMERKYGENPDDFVLRWTAVRDMVKNNFCSTFWNEQYKFLADYVDASGQHLEVRPNQLYAISLPYSPLPEELHPLILRVVDNELMTTRGIRTLSPRDPLYKGVYDGTQIDRDLAYHQGSTRIFLLAPYADASLRIKGPAFLKKAGWIIEKIYEDLGKHGVGTFSELYDGDPPQEPHGAISSALSVAALLTIYYYIDNNEKEGRL